MTYTDKAKKWLSENHAYTCKSVLAFAKFLDEREEAVTSPIVRKSCGCWYTTGDGGGGGKYCAEHGPKPRKEDKPVCLACEYNERNGNDDAKVHTCKPVCYCRGNLKGDNEQHSPECCYVTPSPVQPKPEPIEELSGGVVYADARDEVSKKIAEQMARKIIELQNKLNEVISRLNTLTK